MIRLPRCLWSVDRLVGAAVVEWHIVYAMERIEEALIEYVDKQVGFWQLLADNMVEETTNAIIKEKEWQVLTV